MIERTSVGLDVHARSVVAAAIDAETGEFSRRTMTPDYGGTLAWVGSLPCPVRVVYEAGPTGFGLARFLLAAGIAWVVAAPSKLRRPAGDRVKTDKNDALHLAKLLHLGQIVEVTIPGLAQEAARDLVRAREDVRGDLMSARHRVSKLLLRQGIVYFGGNAWTTKHETWLRSHRFDQPAQQYAFGLAVEIGDWGRLTGNSIGAYVGLVPTESSSGASRSQGGVTKTGNGHVRRLLVEAAWHHRQPYRTPGATMRRRWELASPAAVARGHAGNRRLHERWVGFNAREKRSVVANAAVARELAGWCWSLAVLDEPTG